MLGLAPLLVKRLAEAGIKDPTPIQKQAIPHALDGRDVMGLAQTGTGKTLAFGLPLLDALLKSGTKPAGKSARGLILAPTRELAKQIADALAVFTKGCHLRVQLVVGGLAVGPQINRMARGCDLLVATPGRLIDLMERKAINLSQTQFLVLDEADQMLDLGFIHALRQIAPHLSPERQTMLFSATMSGQMAEIAGTFLTQPVRVEVARVGKPADKIRQGVHFVAQAAKSDLLFELLAAEPAARTLIFARTKHGADRLAKGIEKQGFAVAAIHGNRTQGQRQRAIENLRSGEVPILVATDVAARGLDIDDVEFVYNYELPNVPESYVHRIGRTARAGKGGQAIALVSPAEMAELRAIEKLIKLRLDPLSGRRWDPAEEERPKKPGANSRPRRPGPGRTKPDGPNPTKPGKRPQTGGKPGSKPSGRRKRGGRR